VGLILGNVLIKSILPWGESMGIVVLGGSGLYLICRAWIDEVPDQPFDRNWVIFVLPISLSFDNLFAGAGLGMLGGPIFISAIVIGVMSGMMCMIGLLVGGVVARYLPSRVELFTGVLLLVLAALAIGN
jgi:putative Mn2+ efflux pump MntP